jgi:subfamily B ATP-binding cassette protein MsbA
VTGAVEFKAVSFRYPMQQEWALDDVTLDIKAGETVAFVGRSGSGKTTLVSLLPRFYEYHAGQILLDGEDIRHLSLAALRKQYAMVTQHVILFNDTIANNIAYGSEVTVDADKIIEAAELAHARDFIEKLPQGFETQIGENGARLSGGQRQRLAIARAILKRAPILILDEATSALDTESERAIQAALENIRHYATTLVIAHRLSTIEHADKVVVLDKGRIVEVGKHADLLAKEGYYAALHYAQFRN